MNTKLQPKLLNSHPKRTKKAHNRKHLHPKLEHPLETRQLQRRIPRQLNTRPRQHTPRRLRRTREQNEHHGVEFGHVEYLTGTKHKPLIDEDGWLTAQAHDNLHAKYTEKLSQNPNTTQEMLDSIRINENFNNTIAHYNILIAIPYDTEGTVQKVFEKHVTPFFTTVQSITR